MKRNDKTPPVVVITGASAGVGRAVVRAFAADGAKIGLIACGLEGLEGARRDVEALGGEALALPLDVANPQAADEAASHVEEHFGPIDLWINHAFAGTLIRFIELTSDESRPVHGVTYVGLVQYG